MKSKTLILLTQKFPFESGEEFLATELTYLQKAFDQVIIIPTSVRDFTEPRPIGDNVAVRIVKNPKSIKQVAFAFFRSLFLTLPLLVSELKNSNWNWKLLKYFTYHIPYSLLLKSIISKELNSVDEFVLYSYWMDTNAFAASQLRKENPKIKLIVKSHGGDLYNERQESGEVAFRKSVYDAAFSLLFISEHGLNYVKALSPINASKMKLFKLGVDNFGYTSLVDFPAHFHVVTCSSLIPLKRVDLIAEVLNHSKLPIHWSHFGGTSEAITNLKNRLPVFRNDLKINWKGKVLNEELHDFYASHSVDVFINLSSYEGIPVTIMEAVSFGIPVFANAIGGIPEIVQPETGVLIEDGLSAKVIAAKLDEFLLSGITRDEHFRNNIRSFWVQHYSAQHNHTQLVNHLLSNSFTLSNKLD